MSWSFLVNSVVFVTILSIYCGHLRGDVVTDAGIVRVPLQKSQDVSPKADSVGSDMETNSSALVPADAFKDQISIIEGQLNAGLDALSKDDVDKNKFASQASTKQPGENTEKQAQNAVVQNTNKTTPSKENVNIQDGAQVEQNGVQKPTNAEAVTQNRKQTNAFQHESSTQSSLKNQDEDPNAFADSTETSDPDVTDVSSELSVEFTSSVYPFSQAIGVASSENDKTDMVDSMPYEDDLTVSDDDDDVNDDVDSTLEQTKWLDTIKEEDDEEKKENDDDDENEDSFNYDDEDNKVTTASEEDYEEKPLLHIPNHFDFNMDLIGTTEGNGKFKTKENFIANRSIKAEQSMVSFYTWILLVIIIAIASFLIFKNRHKVQGYILHFSRKRSNGSKMNGEETKNLMSHEYA